jgi:hypothetical protein
MSDYQQPTAKINRLEGADATYYTVSLIQEDGTTITRTVNNAEEALKVKENWENGTHRVLTESDC